jgi:hypothetical protein
MAYEPRHWARINAALSAQQSGALQGRRWLETVVITFLGALLARAASSADPLLLRAAFPWLVLVPLLCAAQHGMLPGLVSSVLLGGLALDHAVRARELTAPVLTWCAGCAIVAAIAGQFQDAAQRRRASTSQSVQRWSQQLQRAHRAHHLLALSHAKLEERLQAARWSLAGSLGSASRRMADLTTPAELAQVLLDVLANQGMVQAASLYRVDARGGLSESALATLGGATGSDGKHPLVAQAVASGQLVAIADPEVWSRTLDRAVIAAVPLISAAQRVVGVVAIHQMPFIAFQPQHLRSLLVLASHVSDSMEDRLAQLATGQTADVHAASETRAQRDSLLGIGQHWFASRHWLPEESTVPRPSHPPMPLAIE